MFFKESSVYGNQLRGFVLEKNYTAGYVWKLDDDEQRNWWQKLPLVFRILSILIPCLIVLAFVVGVIFIYRRIREDRRKRAYSVLQVSEEVSNT